MLDLYINLYQNVIFTGTSRKEELTFLDVALSFLAIFLSKKISRCFRSGC